MTTRKVLAILAVAALAACGEDAKKIDTGSLSGTATYASGSDHSGITISVAGFSATTSATGAWSIADVPAGAQVIVALAPESVERTLTASVIVAGATTAPALSFTRAQAFQGVAAAVGGSAGGITVTLDGGRTTTTAPDGSYSFAGVAAGPHSLAFSSPGYSDSIASVLYSPDLGALVPDPARQNALFRMGVFEMQKGTRVVSSDQMENYSDLSADGALTGFLVPQPGSGTGPLTVASTTPGVAGAIVAPNVAQGSWRFGPDSRSVVYRDDAGALWGAGITSVNPLVVGTPVKLGDGVRQFCSNDCWYYDFSPTLTPGGRATVYFVVPVTVGATTAEILFEKEVASGNQVMQFNLAPDSVSFFKVYRKSARVLYFVAGAQKRLQSAPCTALNGPPIATLDTLVNGWSLRAVSDDETQVAWVVNGVDLGGVLGLKVRPLTFNAPPAAAWDGSTSIGPVRFTPNGARVVYLNYAVSPYVWWSRLTSTGAGTSRALAGTISVGLATASFSADSATVSYMVDGGSPNRIIVGPVDLSGGTVVDQGRILESYSGTCPFFCEYFAGVLSPDASTVAYALQNAVTFQRELWQSPAATPAPAKVADRAGRPSFSPNGQWLLYETYPNYTDLNIRPVAGGASTLVGARYDGNIYRGPNAAGTKLLLRTDQDTSTGAYDVKVVNLATGAVTPLVRKTSFTAWGTGASANRVLSVRRQSPPPFGFQDGVYVSDAP